MSNFISNEMNSKKILDKLTGFLNSKTVNKIKITIEMKWNKIWFY